MLTNFDEILNYLANFGKISAIFKQNVEL